MLPKGGIGISRIDLDAKLTKHAAIACMAVCGILWSTSGALIKFITWNALTLAGTRSLIAGGMLWLFLRAMGRKVVFSRVILLAALAVCVKYISFITATRLTAGANAVAAQYTSPVFVLLILMLFYKKTPRKKDVAVCAATLIGILLMVYEGLSSGGFLGDMLGLLCGMMTAVMYIVMSRLTRYEETMSVTVLGHAMVFLVSIPFIALYPPEISTNNILGILMLGLFQQAGAYILYAFAIRSVSPVTCSVIGCIDPVLSPFWIAMLVGEIPGPMSMLGFAVVIITITLWLISDAVGAAKKIPVK